MGNDADARTKRLGHCEIQQNHIMSLSVPHASLDFDASEVDANSIFFSGTIGPTSLKVHSIKNSTIAGQLATPMDKKYEVSGSIDLMAIDNPPSSHSTLLAYIV
jgi:hypothetical protein